MILAETDIPPNAIIVFIAILIAGIKALIEKRTKDATPEIEEEDDSEYESLYEAYEAELKAQRQQLEIPVVAAPPPLPEVIQSKAPPVSQPKPSPPKAVLNAAEMAALKSFNERSTSPRSKKNKLSTKARVKIHLASPTAAREALLLAEILGPPKALK